LVVAVVVLVVHRLAQLAAAVAVVQAAKSNQLYLLTQTNQLWLVLAVLVQPQITTQLLEVHQELAHCLQCSVVVVVATMT
jgi:hypothetical protein